MSYTLPIAGGDVNQVWAKDPDILHLGVLFQENLELKCLIIGSMNGTIEGVLWHIHDIPNFQLLPSYISCELEGTVGVKNGLKMIYAFERRMSGKTRRVPWVGPVSLNVTHGFSQILIKIK